MSACCTAGTRVKVYGEVMTQYRALDSRTACPWAEDTMKNRRSEITIKVTKEIQVS